MTALFLWETHDGVLSIHSVMQDPDGFIDNGGWNFLDAEGDGSDEDGEESEEEGALLSLGWLQCS